MPFSANCPDAVSLARRFDHRVREKYEIYLSDDLTAELFARERIDLGGAMERIQEGGIGGELRPVLPALQRSTTARFSSPR